MVYILYIYIGCVFGLRLSFHCSLFDFFLSAGGCVICIISVVEGYKATLKPLGTFVFCILRMFFFQLSSRRAFYEIQARDTSSNTE